MTLRIASFIGVLLSALFLPWWFFICAVVVYGFVYQPNELILIGVCIDAQFGEVGTGQGYLYTLTTAVSAIILVTLKPQLRARS